MKTSFFVALLVLVAATALFSCDWFNGTAKQTDSTSAIVGKWQIDSIDVQQDSGKHIGLLTLALLSKDSLLQVEFSKDSIFVNQAPTAAYRVANNQIIVQEDSLQYKFDWTIKADAALELSAADSTRYVLRKIKD